MQSFVDGRGRRLYTGTNREREGANPMIATILKTVLGLLLLCGAVAVLGIREAKAKRIK